jgi:hypothetical protein
VKLHKLLGVSIAIVLMTGFTGMVLANDPIPPAEALEDAFKPQRHYSPYAGRNFPAQVFWGDTHLHTAMSMDAGAFGARLDPEHAYRFARGEQLTSSTGLPVKLSRPLDFLVVADHSDNMGFFPRLFAGDPAMLADSTGKRWYEMVQKGGQEGVKAAVEIIVAFSRNKFPPALASLPGSQAYRSAWETAIKAADKYNDPGKFSAFIGYEWTSNTGGNNLHRVVIYRDSSVKASMTSNGIMFPMMDTFTKRPFDRAYAETRTKWEPLYEVTQIKGDGEAHSYLSPNDEFADYETWDKANLDLSVPKQKNMLQYEYAREALKNGLVLEQRLGVNPYKFGMVGSTDSHTALATAEEDNFFGKHSGTEPGAKRWEHPVGCFQESCIIGWEQAASGYAAVWAMENTRQAIWDAMMRKETYATTGPRMLVRFFGGFDFTPEDAKSRTPATIGYEKGVPMGGDLRNAPKGKAPTFLVAALKDPIGGNLDRIQIVKGWLSKDGKTNEKVYDVVWSGDRKPDAKGKLSPVGNTVDIANATWTNTIGAGELITVWKDPDFNPKQSAFYYARVIEIPTPRWTAYDAKRFGIKMSKEVPVITQERAYTSPIWYTP